MSVVIQVRRVPEHVHRRLKAKAALEGLSLSGFLRREVERIAEQPTLAEIRVRLASREPVKLRVSTAKSVRAERDRR